MWPFSQKNTSEQKNPLQEITFSIKGMHCSSCSMAIDGELEDLPGVKQTHTSYAKAQTKVSFDPSLTSEKTMKETIQKLGYTAST